MTDNDEKRTTSEAVAALERVPRPVAGFAYDYPAGELIPRHSHGRAQLLYAAAGVMRVTTDRGVWVVPPYRAVWIPAGVEHEIACSGVVRMRTLFIDPAACPHLPAGCRVADVPPLLRELILKAVTVPPLYALDGPDDRLMRVVLDQIEMLDVAALHLPVSLHQRLKPVLDALLARPGEPAGLETWARRTGTSGRSLARLFLTETGMTFGAWRQRARLLAALTRLAAGDSVTTVALDLGYESVSAFIAMFRRMTGTTPGQYFSRRASVRSGPRAAPGSAGRP